MTENLSFSSLGHTYLKYANPMSEEKINQALDLASECSPKRILDIGAGNLFILNRFVTKLSCKGVAVELPSKFNNSLKSKNKNSHIEVHEIDAKIYIDEFKGPKFDVAICIGSTHALEGFTTCLEKLKNMVRANGILVIGEGYWKKDPSADYIGRLGGTKDQLMTHAQNLKYIERIGLVPLWASTASLDEWDHYEWSYSKGIEDFLLKNPNHHQSDEFQQKIRQWRNLVWEWGRDTMGFGLYVIRV